MSDRKLGTITCKTEKNTHHFSCFAQAVRAIVVSACEFMSTERFSDTQPVKGPHAIICARVLNRKVLSGEQNPFQQLTLVTLSSS